MPKRIIICLLLVIAISAPLPFSKHYISQAQAPTLEIQDYSVTKLIEYFSGVYNQDPKLLKRVAECESHLNQNAKGDSGLATGLYQYHKGTWEHFSKLKGEVLDINSAYDQAKLTAFIFSLEEVYRKHWTSYVAIKNGGKYSFYSKLLKKHFVVSCNLE